LVSNSDSKTPERKHEAYTIDRDSRPLFLFENDRLAIADRSRNATRHRYTGLATMRSVEETVVLRFPESLHQVVDERSHYNSIALCCLKT
jgi:hypothetical protein